MVYSGLQWGVSHWIERGNLPKQPRKKRLLHSSRRLCVDEKDRFSAPSSQLAEPSQRGQLDKPGCACQDARGFAPLP